MTKEALRAAYKQQRLALKQSQLAKYNDLLLIQFQQMNLPFLQNVLSYFPLEKNNEPDTFLITRFLSFQNIQLNIAYPRMLPGSEMEAVITNVDSEFVEKKYGICELDEGEIMQPHEVEMVLIPLLCCDYNGNRVGYGKGFYDRYLAQCNSNVLKIGLSFFDPIDKIEDVGYGDIPLDVCITPDVTYEF